MVMLVAKIVFWGSLGLLTLSYVGYPLVMFLLAGLVQSLRDLRYVCTRRGRRTAAPPALPRVALLIAAYNEESVIAAKLKNCQELDYPADRLEVLIGLDAPTDNTAEVASAGAGGPVRIIRFSERRGKLAVIRDLADSTSADVLVFSDANTMLDRDAVQRLARHFADPETGAGVGELRVLSHEGGGEMESLYWKYELALKFLESRLNCLMGANGAIYAVRRELFRPSRPWIIEDFQVPLAIRYDGYRVVYDPEAIASEEAAPTARAEFRRKVRIGTGAFQVMFGNLRFLNPFRGMPTFAYLCHKVLRWWGPVLMILTLVSSAVLAGKATYAVLLAIQCACYCAAFFGHLRERRGRSPGIFSVPYYFASTNLSLLIGMFHYFTGRHTTMWSVTARRARAATTA